MSSKLPFHITRGLYNDENLRDMVFLYIQTPSGGIAQGDRHVVELEALEGSKVHITTQGASKVHSMNMNYGLLRVDLKVRKDAYVEFLPDPTILFSDSRYLQMINLEVEEGACALYSELLIPGRVAMGEAFQYEIYCSMIQTGDGSGGRFFQDNILLSPKRSNLQVQGLFGEFNTLGNLYLVTSTVNCTKLAEMIYRAVANQKNVLAGTSTLPGEKGVLVRALGNDSKSVRDVLNAAWDTVRRSVLGVPAPRMRKY